MTNLINNNNNNILILQSSKFFSLFNDFLKDNNFKIEYNAIKFGLEIKNYDGITKKRTTQGYEIHINIISLKQFLINKYNIDFV